MKKLGKSVEDYLLMKKGKLFRKEDRLVTINRAIRLNRKERKEDREFEKMMIGKGYTKKDKKIFDDHINQSLQEFREFKKQKENILKTGHYY